MTKPLYAGLVRVSDMGERRADDDTFHSEGDQIATIKRATPKDAEVEFLPSELDVSGGLPLSRRPILERAVEGVEHGTYRGIVVAYSSRLTRNREVREQVFRRVYAAGGEIRDKRGRIEWDTADGRMVEAFMGAIDANGRERKTEEFDELRKKTVAAGRYAGARPPRGYMVDPTTRRLVPAKRGGAQRTRKREGGVVAIYPAAPVVAAFESIAAGERVGAVAKRLGMSASGVRGLLANRVYVGELRAGEHVNPNAHEPLVSKELFEVVQDALAIGGAPRPGRRGNKAPALLAGLARCASCGHVLTRGSGGPMIIYRCPKRHSGGWCPRPVAIGTQALEEYVEAVVLHYGRRVAAEGSPGADRKRVKGKVAAAERELEAYLKAVSVETVGIEGFQAGARQRREAVDAAKTEQRHLMVLSSAELAMGLLEDWQTRDVRQRNQLLRALLAAVVVAPVGKGQRVPVPVRARVLEAGFELELPNRNGRPSGVCPIPLPDLGTPGVLTLDD